MTANRARSKQARRGVQAMPATTTVGRWMIAIEDKPGPAVRRKILELWVSNGFRR